MKEGILLAGLCVVIVAGVGWYLLPAPAREMLTGSTVVVKAPETAQQQKDMGPAKPANGPRHHAHASARAVEANVSNSASELPTADTALKFQLAPISVVPQFPTPQKVKIGAAASDIVDVFGDPTLAAATQHRGHFFQTYVYRKERSQAIIHLEDGRVANVYLR